MRLARATSTDEETPEFLVKGVHPMPAIAVFSLSGCTGTMAPSVPRRRRF
jgi:hypothetical protein